MAEQSNDNIAITTPSLPPLIPGVTRICDSDGFVGTVLYVGPVASAKNTKEIYAGIAWDDETRGKHDGSVICRQTNNIVRHFSCGPTAGSFLRLSKIDRGVALDSALLRSKYVGKDAPLIAPGGLLPHVARTSGGRDKPIEFLGEIKIRGKQQLQDLNEVSLRGLGIARAVVEEDAIKALEEFDHLKEIDLAGNLLCDWNTVIAIMKQFPLLEWFSIACNRVRDIPPELSLKSGEFDRIRHLNLNGCYLGSFRTVQMIGDAMPNLTELCLAHCDLSDMDTFDLDERKITSDDEEKGHPPLKGFDKLVLLDCSDCSISSWQAQVRRLRFLPNLSELVLNDNQIQHVVPVETTESLSNSDGDKSCQKEFPSIELLQLASNDIKAWIDIDALSSFPSLTALRFQDNPVTANIGAGEARATLIARLPNITQVNSSDITEKERIESERRYVASVARELLTTSQEEEDEKNEQSSSEETMKQQQQQNAISLKHPRFDELMEKHKDSMLSIHSSSSGANARGNIASDAINVTVKSMAASSCDVEPMRKRLPGTLKVGRLKILCSRAFSMDLDVMTLHFKSENDPFPIELDDDENPLYYYGVHDGAEILVNEIDLEERRRDQEREAIEYNRKVEEQEKAASMMQDVKKMQEMKTNAAITGGVNQNGGSS